MTKILLISKDEYLKNLVEKFSINSDFLPVYNKSTNDPLDILSNICTSNPSVVILDDDFLTTNSVRLLETLRKSHRKMAIIFITSNTSLEFGRTINNIGVRYYLMKPFTENEFLERIKSLNYKTEVKT